jgi:hypothetical protein
LKLEKIGKKILDEMGADEKPVDNVKKSAFKSVDSPLTEDDIVLCDNH